MTRCAERQIKLLKTSLYKLSQSLGALLKPFLLFHLQCTQVLISVHICSLLSLICHLNIQQREAVLYRSALLVSQLQSFSTVHLEVNRVVVPSDATVCTLVV